MKTKPMQMNTGCGANWENACGVVFQPRKSVIRVDTSTNLCIQVEDISQLKEMEISEKRQAGITRLLGKIVIAANEVSTIDSAIKICLDEVCELTGWLLGHAYLARHGEQDTFVTKRSHHSDNHEHIKALRQIGETIRFSAGYGLPDRILRFRRPAWIDDFSCTKELPQCKSVKQCGDKGRLCVSGNSGR